MRHYFVLYWNRNYSKTKQKVQTQEEKDIEMDKSPSEMPVVWNHSMEHVGLANCTRYAANTNPLPSISRPWHHIPIPACRFVVHCFFFALFISLFYFYSFNCISFSLRSLSHQYIEGYKSNTWSLVLLFLFFILLFSHSLV